MCGRGRYISRFLLCLLCAFPLGSCAKTIFSRKPIFQHLSQTRRTSQTGPAVNTAEFTHLQRLTRIFIIFVLVLPAVTFWPYILISRPTDELHATCSARRRAAVFFQHLRRAQGVLCWRPGAPLSQRFIGVSLGFPQFSFRESFCLVLLESPSTQTKTQHD